MPSSRARLSAAAFRRPRPRPQTAWLLALMALQFFALFGMAQEAITPVPRAKARSDSFRTGAPVAALLIVKQGDIPPGAGGNPVVTLNAPFTDSSGVPGFTGSVDGANPDHFVWYNSGIVFRNSEQPAAGLSGAESTMGIAGGAFVFSPTTFGDDALWTQAGLLVAGGQAPELTPGVLSTLHTRPRMLPDGTVYWISGFDDGAGGGTTGRVLYRSESGSPGDIEIVLRSDDEITGFTIGRPAGVGFNYDIADNDQHHIHALLMDTGSTTNDAFIYVDGNLLAREGEATGTGDNWDNFDQVSINNSGDFLFCGDTDGATASDEFIAYNGSVAVREGDTLDTVTLTSPATLRALSLNNLGMAVHLWGGGDTREHLFIAPEAADLSGSRLLLQTGDTLDFDGNGTSDAVVVNFNGALNLGPYLCLAENGLVYVNVSVDDGAGVSTAIIGLSAFALPCEPLTTFLPDWPETYNILGLLARLCP